jgi:hypothetical protein
MLPFARARLGGIADLTAQLPNDEGFVEAVRANRYAIFFLCFGFSSSFT